MDRVQFDGRGTADYRGPRTRLVADAMQLRRMNASWFSELGGMECDGC